MSFYVKLLDSEAELPIHHSLPPELLPYQVFPHAMAVIGNWGAIIFQVMITPDFSIWYCNYIIHRDISFIIGADIETIELSVAYKNILDFELESLGEARLQEGQFNLTYLPRVRTKAHFKVGEYASFDIAYSKQYLQRFIPHLPALEVFLENTTKNIPCHLSAAHPFASHKMLEVVNNVLHHEYEDNLSSIYIECKALELLTLAIAKMGSKKGRSFVLTDTDIELLNSVKSWLSSNVDNPGSLSHIAQRFGINEYKLKKGFKELFGTTVFDCLLKIRMERAKQQLLTTTMSVSEIAYRAGYSNHNHFAVAFKKYFNYSPNYIRKK